MSAGETMPIQRTTRLTWWFGAVSTAVSAVAAVQLLVLTSRTGDFFAWTIAVPASAAFIGVFYLTAAVMGLLALGQPWWTPARTALLPVVGFVGVVLIVTLVNLHSFHLTSGGFPARAAAWIWLAVYVLTPPAYAFAFWWQGRAPGGSAPRTAPLPAWIRGVLAALGVILTVAGVALLLVPAIAPLWPWQLTPLTAGMVGSTLLGVALLAASVAVVNDRATGRIAAVGLVVFAVGGLVVVVGYGSAATQWSKPSAWGYVVACMLLATAAAVGSRRATRI